MFCDGICKKKNKKCGLLYEVIMEHNSPDGSKKIETVEKCVFHHILDSMNRQETGQIRIQQAVEDSRNEKANSDHKISSVVATGFMGMLHAFNEDAVKFKRSLKLLSRATQSIPEDKNV